MTNETKSNSAHGVGTQRDRRGSFTARDRLRAERKREAAAARRKRRMRVAGVAAGVLALAAGVGMLLVRGGADGAGNAAEARPVTTGSSRAPVTLTVYEDFRCPACRQFETQYGPTVRDLERRGLLKTRYHLVSMIDGNTGGHGSARAANAALCAQDRKRFAPFHDALYRNQPPEQQDAYAGTDRLLAVAARTPGLAGNAAFARCVRDDLHRDRVKASHAEFEKSGHEGTPTVLLGKRDLFAAGSTPLTPDQLRTEVERQARA